MTGEIFELDYISAEKSAWKPREQDSDKSLAERLIPSLPSSLHPKRLYAIHAYGHCLSISQERRSQHNHGISRV